MPQVEAGNQTKQIQLDAFDPSQLDGRKPVHVEFDASAAVGQAGVNTLAKIAADSVRRKADSEFGHRAQD